MKTKKEKILEALEEIEISVSLHYAMLGHPDSTAWKDDKILYKPFKTIRKQAEDL